MYLGGNIKWKILTEAADFSNEISHREKCMTQSAQNVAKNVKYRSSQPKANLYSVVNVIQKEKDFSNWSLTDFYF